LILILILIEIARMTKNTTGIAIAAAAGLKSPI